MAKRETPLQDLKDGLGLLFRAARGAAGSIRHELEKTDIGKSIDDAGRELGRAMTNVVGRLGAELKKVQPPEPDYIDPDKPKGPTPEDPGFTIAEPPPVPGEDDRPR